MTKLTILTITKEALITLLMILVLASAILIRRTIANLEMRTVSMEPIVSHHCFEVKLW